MNDVTSRPSDTRRAKTWTFLQRWQDFLGWLPATVVLFYLSYKFLGVMDPIARQDQIPLVIGLAIKIMYVLAALGLTHLARRRWRINMSEEQKAEYWDNLMHGHYAPVLMLILDAIVTLCLIKWLLTYFALPS